MHMSTLTIALPAITKKLLMSLSIVLCSTVLFAQQKITGVIRNTTTNQPVENVTIQVKGTQRGTTSAANGSFTIEASPDETLVISSVGFQPTEVRVRNQGNLTISLTELSNELEGVVVTALGITRKEKALGFSVSELKGEELTDAMSNNWTNALSGKVAGLNMLKSGGGPAGSNRIVLRG